jgi:hypothetical protein
MRDVRLALSFSSAYSGISQLPGRLVWLYGRPWIPVDVTGPFSPSSEGLSPVNSKRIERIEGNNMSDHEVVANQKTILGHQATILENQKTLLHNQAAILKNQAALDEILANQKIILANQKTILANQKEAPVVTHR